MQTQWDYMLKNAGEWEGSFTQIDLNGSIVSDIASHLQIESLGDHHARLTLTRKSPKHPQPLVIDYHSLNSSILFTNTGAFSQGALQFSPISQFGGEFGHLWNDRRLRLVKLFSSDQKLETVTLIREKRPGSEAKFADMLSIDDLLGTWEGEAMTYYPDLRSPETFTSTLKIDRTDEHTLSQSLTFSGRTIASTARIEGQSLFFEQGPLKTQVLRLPDRASASFPVDIPKGVPFFLESGWMPEPHVRYRLIRSYDNQGRWTSLTQVKEVKV